MEDDLLTQILPTMASLLALALSLVNLYLQRRDRRPRLKIRVRYEYRVGDPTLEVDSEDKTSPRIHYDSQEGLYLRLGDFLREYELDYPRGTPLVRFSLSNEGERAIYLASIRLTLWAGKNLSRERLALDPVEDRILSSELAGATSNLIHSDGIDGRIVELVPGDSAGYKLELVRLANTLKREGYSGNTRLTLEATDRIGNAYRSRFEVNTDLWAYPQE
ncbi:MAG: hypothetical protein H0U04_10390 [Rubrobacter sp.]|nr:hypothetical protein [Rubrobacter sp.]